MKTNKQNDIKNGTPVPSVSSEDLIAAASAMPKKNRHNTDTIIGAVEIMRSKGYSFREIHKFLLDKGVHVNPVASTFTSAMSQRLKRARIKAMEGAI